MDFKLPAEVKDILSKFKKNNFEKVAIISQTTMSVYGYKKLIDELNSIMDNGKFEEIHLSMKDLNKKYGYVDTICNPTKQRQVGTEELAKEADVMIVIGGKNSSNSKELAHKCEEIGVETYFIQEESQLQGEWLNGRRHIGVTAGASTPDETIKNVVERIKEMANGIPGNIK